jgi:hypothetical protein
VGPNVPGLRGEGTAAGSPTAYARPAAYSVGVVGFYAVLILVMLYVYYRGAPNLFSTVLVPVVIIVLMAYLARYSSTRYRIDDRSLLAWRLFGTRRMELRSITRIRRANLRGLAPVGFLGTWGWRGRVWSPIVGSFDTVHTGNDGLLISGTGVPLFVTPVDPNGFQRELSRRVRSVNGGAEVDLDPI